MSVPVPHALVITPEQVWDSGDGGLASGSTPARDPCPTRQKRPDLQRPPACAARLRDRDMRDYYVETAPPRQLVAATEINLSLSAPEENVPGLSGKTHQKSRRAATGQVATSRNQGLGSNLNWRVGLRKGLCPNLLLHSRFSAGTMRSLLLFSLR